MGRFLLDSDLNKKSLETHYCIRLPAIDCGLLRGNWGRRPGNKVFGIIAVLSTMYGAPPDDLKIYVVGSTQGRLSQHSTEQRLAMAPVFSSREP